MLRWCQILAILIGVIIRIIDSKCQVLYDPKSFLEKMTCVLYRKLAMWLESNHALSELQILRYQITAATAGLGADPGGKYTVLRKLCRMRDRRESECG